jgi:hypothetical protein
LPYDKDKDRYYHKESYEAAIGTFATAIVFTFVAILSLVFNTFNIDFIGLRWWGYWLFIPAFFIFIGGFTQLYTNFKYKKAILNAVRERGNQGSHKLENLALEVGIKPKDVLRVLADLRDKGKVQYRFNPDTGEIELGQSIRYVKSEQFQHPPKENVDISSEQRNFCAYCGQKLDSRAQYCPNCGSKL